MIDMHIPLTGELYSWSQGESTWFDVSREDLITLLESDKPPAFRTVLGKTGDVFSGPFYIDIDFSEDDGGIESSIGAVNAILDKFEAEDVDLNCVRLFATGGRGFHLEIPREVFGGTDHERLPQIYKAMALEMFVDGVDLRVYSGGRGRQWRVPNIRRPNGHYQVPITVDEARSLDVTGYRQMCSEPRRFPPLKAPVLASGLSMIWTRARDREKSRPVKRTFARAEGELRQRFAGDAPPSVRALLDGAHLPDAGWNQIAIQLGLLAHGLGWSDDRLVSEASRLIERHQSDGTRYRTPRQREAELRRMFDYVDGNPAYSFSIGGLCSLLPGGHKPDLQGLDADLTEDQPDYADMIDEAAGDAAAVVDVARRVAADPALSRTQAELLLKRAAKSAGVAARVLRSDLFLRDESDGLFIDVVRHDFASSVDSALRVLPRVPGLRQRSGELVEAQGGRIGRVDLARLAYKLSSVARWRYAEGIGAPDGQVLQALLSAGHWPGVPELVGVAHQPSLLRDRTIGTPEGFEPQYKVEDFEPYAGTPAEALALLQGLISEFPFASERDHAAAQAAILTAVARPGLRTAPGFLVTANEAGTGKGYLSQLVALFACPDAEPMPWPTKREEQMKILHSALSDGRAVTYFDNLRTGSTWDSETLCSAITEPTITSRVLGVSEMRKVSTRTLVIANGNNVRVGGDLARRVIKVELVADEGVITRRFRADPVATVRADRGRWVTVALRALQGARADHLTPFASFAEWTATVRSVLVGAGLPDVLTGVVEAVEADDDRATLGFLLEAWHERFGCEPVTLRDAWRGVGYHSDLRSLLLDIAGKGDDLDLQRAGYWFRANAGRVVGGRKLVQAGRSRKGAAWVVV